MSDAGHATREPQFEDVTIEYALVRPDGFGAGTGHPVLLVLPPGSGGPVYVDDYLDAFFRNEARARGWVVASPSSPYDAEIGMRMPYHLGSETLIPAFLDGLAAEVAFEGGHVHLARGGAAAFRFATLYPDALRSIVGPSSAFWVTRAAVKRPSPCARRSMRCPIRPRR